MDIVLGAFVLAILVALHLFMIVVAHHARLSKSESAPPAAAPSAAADRTRVVWESGG